MRNKGLIAGIILLIAAYVAYPYLALHRLGDAVRRSDVAAVDSKVDWPALRQGFKDDATALIASKMHEHGMDTGGLAGFGKALAGRIIGGVTDNTINPTGLIILFQRGHFDPLLMLDGTSAEPKDEQPMPRIQNAFFAGLTSFEADLLPQDPADGDKPMRIRLELEGGSWMLTRIHLSPPSE